MFKRKSINSKQNGKKPTNRSKEQTLKVKNENDVKKTGKASDINSNEDKYENEKHVEKQNETFSSQDKNDEQKGLTLEDLMENNQESMQFLEATTQSLINNQKDLEKSVSPIHTSEKINTVTNSSSLAQQLNAITIKDDNKIKKEQSTCSSKHPSSSKLTKTSLVTHHSYMAPMKACVISTTNKRPTQFDQRSMVPHYMTNQDRTQKVNSLKSLATVSIRRNSRSLSPNIRKASITSTTSLPPPLYNTTEHIRERGRPKQKVPHYMLPLNRISRENSSETSRRHSLETQERKQISRRITK